MLHTPRRHDGYTKWFFRGVSVLQDPPDCESCHVLRACRPQLVQDGPPLAVNSPFHKNHVSRRSRAIFCVGAPERKRGWGHLLAKVTTLLFREFAHSRRDISSVTEFLCHLMLKLFNFQLPLISGVGDINLNVIVATAYWIDVKRGELRIN